MLTAFAPGGFEVPLPVVVLGTITGLTYGLLAVGLVLVYRSNRVINFAHGELGAFGAAILSLAITRWHVPYWVGLPLILVVTGGVGALAEVAVVRRLRNAPRIMSIVATLGVGQFLVLFALAINAGAGGVGFPEPPGLPEFQLGPLRVTRAHTGIVLLAPLVVAGLALFLRYSRLGVAIRVSAANPDLARMSAIFAGRMSSLVWALAAALSALTAILVAPTQGLSSAESFGPELLLRALACAVIGRMTSLPVSLAAGVGLGVVEQLLLWNYPRSGLVEVVLLAVILGVLLVQRRERGREDEKGTWAAVQPWRPLPGAVARLWPVRNLGRMVGLGVFAVAVLLPLVITHSAAITLVGIMGFAIVGLSVGVVTGLGGQLSLGQFALAAIGATISYHVTSRVGNFPLAFLCAGLGAAAVSLLIGLPALRVRGLMLAVTTLSFALVVPTWLLQQSWALGSGVDPGRPVIGGTALDTGKEYYYFALAVTVVMVVLAHNIRRAGLGRLLVAVRDNEQNARAFTVRAGLVKMQGFLLAGFIAGVGGAAYGHALARIGSASFPTVANVDVVVMTVLGGLGSLAGPLIGVFYYVGVPAFVPLDSAGLAATRLGGLLLILYAPGGLAQVLQPARDRLVRAIARHRTIDVEATAAPHEAPTTTGAHVRTRRPIASPPRPGPAGTVLLDAVDLHKRFGGVTAVDGVSLRVEAGETLGLIGPNGAGKTTLFELLGGFTRPDRGQVVFRGRDMTRLGPEGRGRLGLIRSFQDAALFPTMTVTETVQVALERVAPTRFLGSALGFTRGERARQAEARELVAFMGLDPYRDTPVRELSTGTRRITELTCLVALRPTLLLLDEPSSGIAQRETEALGQLLEDLKAQLGTTLVVIEHDIPLIMGLSGRIVAMDAGSVIAVGPPELVRNDPRVVEAYLGGSLEAIERSGARIHAGGSPAS